MYDIVEKRILQNDIEWMRVRAPFVARNAQPGHFVMVRVDADGERVPLTIVDHDQTDVVIIYQKLGYTTRQLSFKQEGDTLETFQGPLGKAAHIRDKQHVIGVAGGVGSAPLLPQLKAYKEKGIRVDAILGARSQEYLILLDEYRAICDHVYITTDDGSLGQEGRVTDALKIRLETDASIDHVIAIGPAIMMKYVVEMAKSHQRSVDVSLNPIMIDGTGMCGNCRVSIAGKTFFACIDGPDFAGEAVDFDELIARQSYYKKEEHDCFLRLKDE
ncbi:MAG: sulfide/dihydroorotate dehydrogenase-like FAD/NAD-binding protein [Acholeplasmatales bacterium]|nr:MAG: sulfide/dihydroorotate dehydrogenase-like FAD/NAD-binding protein [Acholeplasmatales bacterium]